nr:hypothetical protein IBNDOAIG_00024 [uncultured bacterium]
MFLTWCPVSLTTTQKSVDFLLLIMCKAAYSDYLNHKETCRCLILNATVISRMKP